MPFSPSDISGLKIWLKADAGAGSSDNDPVGTWTDQSGTSHDFTQATAGKKPLYKTNIRNSLAVVRFDGTDDEMSGGNLSAVFPTAGSMFCAVSPDGADNSLMVYKTKDNDSHWSFGGSQFGYWGAFRSTRLAVNGTPMPLTGWHVWSMTAVASAYKVWVDASSRINAGSFTFDGGNNHNLGRQVEASYYQGMDLGELIVYDSVLSDADRISVQNYLSTRWAITFPDATVSPATVVGTGAVPAPTAFGGTAVAGVVVGIGVVPAASASGTAVAAPATVVGTGSVPAPTVSGETNATPMVVAAYAAVPAPLVFGEIVTAPSTVVGIGTVPAPDAIGSGAGEATPNRVIGTATTPAVTANGLAYSIPMVVVGRAAVPAPTVGGGSTVAPIAVAGLGTIPAPTVGTISNPTVTPATVRGIGRIPTPHFPSTVASGGGSGGSGGTGVSEVSAFWSLYLSPPDG